MITVLGRANSVNVQKVMWCAGELGLAVDRRDVGGAFGGTDAADYRALNPNGKVPTLVDGDFVLWESNAIVRYLCEAHGRAPWNPPGIEDRARAGQWMDWYLTTLHPAMTVVFWQLVRTAADKRDRAAIAAATAEAAAGWRLLDAHFADRSFVLGAEPSMADIPVGCAAYRWHAMELERPDLPSLKAWWDRLAARPAYRSHVMLPLT